jgi:3-deoxy-D-manno-octulosonic acid (KDO) 8-phosphate synthase
MPCFHAGAGAAAALGASTLELESVAQPCNAKSDEAITVMDANEIDRCFMFVFLLFMTWFY